MNVLSEIVEAIDLLLISSSGFVVGIYGRSETDKSGFGIS
jgi:hypothetical protein